MIIKKRILPLIVLAQFCCTSLWFAGNAVIDDLILNFDLAPSALGHLTSAVQFGFICGTLLFALLSVADRFSPSKVFFYCALLGSLCNLSILIPSNSFISLLFCRLLVGFFLAGIYPVGMKLAADYYQKGLGKSLGYLVGALVLGTALPHLLKTIGTTLSWRLVIGSTSLLSLLGGSLIALFVPDGPYRTAQTRINFKLIPALFKKRSFRVASFGYFGHMWELYAFWAFIPLILSSYFQKEGLSSYNLSFYSFLVIAIGSLGCVLGGYLSQRFGAKPIAFACLLASGLCCLLFPWFFSYASPSLFLGYLLFWGLVVITDSPLFSSMVANNSEAMTKATALTIVNCIGFSITIVSIQFLNLLSELIPTYLLYTLLALGPIVGLIYRYRAKSFKQNP